MPFVIAAPEVLVAVATDTASIGSQIRAANTTAAAPDHLDAGRGCRCRCLPTDRGSQCHAEHAVAAGVAEGADGSAVLVGNGSNGGSDSAGQPGGLGGKRGQDGNKRVRRSRRIRCRPGYRPVDVAIGG